MIFELPLHEQTRVLIRLEYLFNHLELLVKKSDFNSIYLGLKTLDETLSILERSNLKKYLLMEIKDVTKALIIWREHSLASVDKIDNLLNQLSSEKAYIESGSGGVADILVDNDFLKIFRQRSNIPGGTSVVDFPRFHFWLRQDKETLQASLKSWLDGFENISRPIKLILSIVRKSAVTSTETAEDGFYQKSLDKNVEYKLIRATLAETCPCFAEISGGRYHITVRMVYETENGTIGQYMHDVKFKLTTCKI